MNALQTSIKLNHFLTVETLSNEEVFGLIQRAQAFKSGKTSIPHFPETFATNLFFENSTRTQKSFEVAERLLGMNVIPFEVQTSSVQKGETLYDTVLTMDALGVDVVVIRHSEEKYYEPIITSGTIHCSIVNGGDGAGQHPSQSMLDLMTIYEEFGTFEGLRVAIVGDLRHSRVARSNMQLLYRLGATLLFSGPSEWFDLSFAAYGEWKPMDEVVEQVDVLMLLRVQHERHGGEDEAFAAETYHQAYGLTLERATRLAPTAIIMHPAPVNRGVEIADCLVESKQSRIVQQMRNGVFVRMAIVEAIMASKVQVGKEGVL